MKEDVLTTLLASLNELNPSERKVAQYILAHPKEVVHLSIALLSQKAGVSEPTVMRFCRSMGNKGYQEFKLQLAINLASSPAQPTTTIRQNDSPSGIADTTCSNMVSLLHKLQENLSNSDIEHAIELLRTAKRIEIYGSGNSGLVASHTQYQLCGINILSTAHCDNDFQVLSASKLNSDCLALVLSYDGESASSINIAQRAGQQGAMVLGIAPKESSLSRHCHKLIHCPMEDTTFSLSPTGSMICQLLIVDTLVSALAKEQNSTTA